MSSHRAIEKLIFTYAELVDSGDLAGLGLLLADATYAGGSGSVHGRDAIEKMFRTILIIYGNGTPRTKHVTTNVSIEVDEAADTATSKAYFTVLQAVPEVLPLQIIASGTYNDSFQRRDGQWSFVERRVRVDLLGDTSHHLRL
jgi:3-phenylpropionate/cinnamic acid dioxygenase small subunit